MTTLITRPSIVALSLCLVHCGSGKTTSGGPGSTTGDSSGAVSETSGMLLPDLGDTDGPAGCLLEVWSWTHDQNGWSGADGGLAAPGSRFQAVGRLAGASVTLAVSADGSLAWGPQSLADADPQAWFRPGIVGLTSGDALTITSGVAGARLERWSANGDSTGSLAIPGDGYRLGPAALTPDGGIVAGGFVGASELEGEAVLMSLSPDSVPAWDIRLDHNLVAAVSVDRTGTIFVLAVDRFTEGGEVHLEALEPTGLGKWGLLAGSNTGFTMMGALTPFAVTPDDEGGAYTLGQQHHLNMGDTPASDEMLLTRHLPTGELAWEVRAGAPDVIDGGGLAVVGDDLVFSAVDSQSSTSLVLHRGDGTFVCEQSVAHRRARAVLASSHDEVVVSGQVTTDGPAWFARYRVALN